MQCSAAQGHAYASHMLRRHLAARKRGWRTPSGAGSSSLSGGRSRAPRASVKVSCVARRARPRPPDELRAESASLGAVWQQAPDGKMLPDGRLKARRTPAAAAAASTGPALSESGSTRTLASVAEDPATLSYQWDTPR